MKLTKKQIDIIIRNTKPELKGTYCTLSDEIGYYMKSDANWAYHAGYTHSGDIVVTVFGKVQ